MVHASNDDRSNMVSADLQPSHCIERRLSVVLQHQPARRDGLTWPSRAAWKAALIITIVSIMVLLVSLLLFVFVSFVLFVLLVLLR